MVSENMFSPPNHLESPTHIPRPLASSLPETDQANAATDFGRSVRQTPPHLHLTQVLITTSVWAPSYLKLSSNSNSWNQLSLPSQNPLPFFTPSLVFLGLLTPLLFSLLAFCWNKHKTVKLNYLNCHLHTHNLKSPLPAQSNLLKYRSVSPIASWTNLPGILVSVPNSTCQ